MNELLIIFFSDISSIIFGVIFGWLLAVVSTRTRTHTDTQEHTQRERESNFVTLLIENPTSKIPENEFVFYLLVLSWYFYIISLVSTLIKEKSIRNIHI